MLLRGCREKLKQAQPRRSGNWNRRSATEKGGGDLKSDRHVVVVMVVLDG